MAIQAKLKPLKKDEFYVVVDQFVDDPVTGELMLKQPVFRHKFLAVNRPAFTDANQIAHQAVKVMINPDDTNGIYPVLVNSGFSGEKSEVMKFKVEQYKGQILGPFDDPNEAVMAKHHARPKTKNETVARLEGDNNAKDAELVALRERLAELEAKPKQQGPKEPTKKDDEKKKD
jgi:hypothetical protein